MSDFAKYRRILITAVFAIALFCAVQGLWCWTHGRHGLAIVNAGLAVLNLANATILLTSAHRGR